MKKGTFTLTEKRQLTKNIFELKLTGDCSGITNPGQFVNIELDGLYLRRPISVCDVCGDTLTLVCRVVGKGTERLCNADSGSTFDLLSGLGNGYDIKKQGKAPLLAGGGVGVPPLYLLAKKLIEAGIKPYVALGFSDESDVFYEKEFCALGLETAVATVDGSYAQKGFVTNAAAERFPDADYVFCCGPEPMLKAVYALPGITGGQFSFEERMGCGFGACMGCSCETKYGSKRICKDGPVLFMEEIIW